LKDAMEPVSTDPWVIVKSFFHMEAIKKKKSCKRWARF